MTLLAHLSDLHLLEMDHAKRFGLARRRLQILNLGSRADARERFDKTVLALELARRADHLVLTGDLTEDGASGQFEVLAQALQTSGWDPQHVTIVPGNHDAYYVAGAFDQASKGCLSAYHLPGAAVHLKDVILAPLSTMLERQWLLARGHISHEDIERIRRASSENPDIPIVAVQHHPPEHHKYRWWEWFDGVGNAAALHELMMENPRIHCLHGHVHERTTRYILGRRHPQIMSVASVRGQSLGAALRFYAPKNSILCPVP